MRQDNLLAKGWDAVVIAMKESEKESNPGWFAFGLTFDRERRSTGHAARAPARVRLDGAASASRDRSNGCEAAGRPRAENEREMTAKRPELWSDRIGFTGRACVSGGATPGEADGRVGGVRAPHGAGSVGGSALAAGRRARWG